MECRYKKARNANNRFANVAVWCLNENEVQTSSFVHLKEFSAENPEYAKRKNINGHTKITNGCN
jgi:hypothetical protein